MSGQLVLVTGGSSFIGTHCIVQALNEGYKVRATVRSVKKSDEVRQSLRNGGISEEAAQGVEFAEADLMSDNGWPEAVKDCTYVLHVASPFPPGEPKDENELIIPARDGTLRMLRAAAAAGTVKRVVITSSFASIGFGHPTDYRTLKNPYTEADWTVTDKPVSHVSHYTKSKTVAERAAWDFIKDHPELELATVNPVLVLGPVLSGAAVKTSLELPYRLLTGKVPGLPDLTINVVDVRDVAELHLKAMVEPSAAGQRYLATAGDPYFSFQDIAKVLKENCPPEQAKKVATRKVPTWLLRIVGLVDPAVSMLIGELGIVRPMTCAKAERELGYKPRSAKESIMASAESMKKFGII